jgi:ABC-type amino acid transport substrate-binding protein
MQKDNGLINTMVLDSTAELERDLIAVKVPVDKGMLGYRVFLIRAEDQPRFSAVRTIDDLRKFTMGQGSDWSDVAIYKSAGFNVVGATRYASLFDMLMHGRFDAFGRGVAEVVDELAAHQKKYPDMAIEQTTLLYYPMAVYFWFPKTSEGKLHAKRVTEGMAMIAKNGTFDRIFKEQYGPLLSQLQIKKRRIFRIPNPTMPPNQPFEAPSLWFDPLR